MSASVRLLGAGVGILILGAACGTSGDVDLTRSSPRAAPPATARSTPSPTPASVPTPAETPADDAPRFVGISEVIGPDARARMTSSWHPGCPVSFGDLRLLTMSYWGFDRRAHTGELVVNANVAEDVLSVFEALFDQRFPIRRMRLVDEYEADDDRSMAADNTSGFNCRSATGHPGVWSEHSYGWAIDINPRENPYVAGSFVAPPEGADFLDRTANTRGMIHAGDEVVRAFAAVGWTWGGTWDSVKDYQHFSLTGR